MKVIIVGHGPSLIGKGLGSVIDNYDLVVRLKGCVSVLGTPDYGSRCDVLCMSTEVLGLAKNTKPEVFWLYPKRGLFNKQDVGMFVAEVGKPVLLPLELCINWNEHFRNMGATHPNVSTGMAAILIAAEYMTPEQITLAGFDTLIDPKVTFTRNDSIPRTGTGVITHDWVKENVLLKQLSERYRFTIATL